MQLNCLAPSDAICDLQAHHSVKAAAAADTAPNGVAQPSLNGNGNGHASAAAPAAPAHSKVYQTIQETVSYIQSRCSLQPQVCAWLLAMHVSGSNAHVSGTCHMRTRAKFLAKAAAHALLQVRGKHTSGMVMHASIAHQSVVWAAAWVFSMVFRCVGCPATFQLTVLWPAAGASQGLASSFNASLLLLLLLPLGALHCCRW
jgi:hypothetical protein